LCSKKQKQTKIRFSVLFPNGIFFFLESHTLCQFALLLFKFGISLRDATCDKVKKRLEKWRHLKFLAQLHIGFCLKKNGHLPISGPPKVFWVKKSFKPLKQTSILLSRLKTEEFLTRQKCNMGK